MSNKTFKIFFANEIRRFSTDAGPTFEDFVSKLSELFPNLYHPELRIQYQDSEGDKIAVTSQVEWEEMFSELKESAIIKLHVVEAPNTNYFKDSDAPQPVLLYDDPVEKTPVEEGAPWYDLRERVPKALANLFPGGKILPHNMPTFLKDIVTVMNLGNNEVNLDVDIPAFFRALETQALNLMDYVQEKEKLVRGRTYLLSQLILSPENPTVLYNLACVESLLGNVNTALATLEKAILAGWHDVEHMIKDSDLIALHNLPQFSELVDKAKQYVYKTDKKEEEVKEEKKEESKEEVKPDTEPVKSEEPSYKYQNELNMIHAMGFLNDSLIVPSLEKHKGNVQSTITDLLG